MLADTITPGSAPDQPRVVVVQHWLEEVKAKIPG
jgi:hypothetical protein